MPFLVDSVSMALAEEQHDIHLVIHPQFVVRRDLSGQLHEVLDEQAAADSHDVARESWMHLEIDRVPDDQLGEIQELLTKVLTDVRDAVEDWERMHAQVEQIVEDLEENPPPLPETEVEQGVVAAALARATTTSPSSATASTPSRRRDGEETLVAVPGTGFGILRADPPAPRVLPEAVASRARDKHLLVLAKANSRATVHRPVYLDYVGVKKFDENGEVVGERRFLGLFSSAAYTESVRRIPVLREKAAEVIDTVGLDPMSHAGKALMDVLETYPRDELFQTPVEDLVPIASQVMYTRERRQLKLFVRRDIYGRFLSCLVYLPARPLQHHRPRADRGDPQGAARAATASSTPPTWGSPSPRGCTSSYARPRGSRSASPTSPTSSAAVPRRPDPGATTSAQRGDLRPTARSRAAAWSARYAECFPEAYKEDYPPQTGAVDLGRLEQIEGDEGLGALALRGRRGAARRGAAEGLPDRPAALALRGAADPVHHRGRGGRRAALPARGPRPGVLHLRLRAALPPADARPRARAVPGHRRGGVGRAATRATASTRSCSLPG